MDRHNITWDNMSTSIISYGYYDYDFETYVHKKIEWETEKDYSFMSFDVVADDFHQSLQNIAQIIGYYPDEYGGYLFLLKRKG
jgi:hypothetical protein